MQYLTYEEYKALGGSADETAFQILEFKARKRIDYLTDCRVRDYMGTISDAVKMAMKVIMDMEAAVGLEAQATNPQATSFNTDGYSESYGNAIGKDDAGSAMNKAAHELLYGELDDRGVPLLYLGVDV